ncbi:nuclear pore complex protein [Canna indica]|uniref:Nuclear pore complex protein n=1 Tax=Canna indica TaxID=4628 RepID=A0AAQ3QCS0_9LILI|nr:nuclear pore complex protein [Canna indica]
METPSYEGRIGGKMRRQPLRRAAATPYARPPAAARAIRLPQPDSGANRWLAKLVDPASRFIASSATRLFTSVFRRQLPAPLIAEAEAEAPGENSASGKEVAEASGEPSSELQKDKVESENIATNKHNDKMDSQNNATNNPENDIVSELDQLLKQKTLTRKSRTIDLNTPKPTVNDKKLEDVNVPLPEKETESTRPHSDLMTSPNIIAIADDQAASPVELAKAYMGSRVSKLSPPSLSWQSHLIHESRKVPTNSAYAIKSSDMRGPKSVQFSGHAESPESSYRTPRYHGRSALYRMACSPYFKGEGYSKDGYVGSSSLQTPSAWQSGGRQVVKRRSSVLDNDFGSVGPIRRIRQKLNVTPSKNIMHSVPPRNIHSSPSTSTKKEIQDHSSFNQKPAYLDARGESRANRISNSAVTSELAESTDMGNKILQKLDKLVPSPKEKMSTVKDNLLDGSPANVMLAFSKGINNSLSHKQERTEANENGPSTSISGVKSISTSNNMHGSVVPITAAMHGKDAADVANSHSISSSVHQRPTFQMSEPEDAILNKTSMVDTPFQLKHRDEVKLTQSVGPSKIRTEGSPPKLAASIPTSSSLFSKAADVKLSSIDSVAENGKSFTFPFVSASATSQPPPTPTMPSPLVDKSVMQKGYSSGPSFTFGSNDTNRVKFFSITSASSSYTTSGLENGLSNATTSTILKNSSSDKGEGKYLTNSVGDADAKDKQVSDHPIVFSFGASSNESLPNGSPKLSSPSSTASIMTLSGSPSSSTFSMATAVLTSSSSTSTSSAAGIFSTVPSLLFESTPSPISSTSFSQPVGESNAGKSEEKPSNSSMLSLTSATSDKSLMFKFGGNSSSAPIVGSQLSRADSGILAASTVSNIGSSSASTSNLFSSTDKSQSAFAPTSTFLGANSSIFNIGSTKSSNFSSPAVVNITKTSPSVTAAGFFGTQSTQVESRNSQFSQSSTSQFNSFHSSPTFGMNASSSSSLTNSQSGAATTDSKPFLSSSTSFSVGAGTNLSSSTSLSGSQFGVAAKDSEPLISSSPSSFAAAPAPAPAAIASTMATPTTTSTNTNVFGSTFQPSTSSGSGIFGSIASSPTSGFAFGASSSPSGIFGSGASSPATGFTFGGSSTGTGSMPFVFGSSSSPAFSLNSAPTSTSSFTPGNATFGSLNSASGFSSASAGNDQMNVEDSMAEDTNQSAGSMVPQFGQPAMPASPAFGAPAIQPASSVFQFGSQQNLSLPQNPSPFQASANQEFPQGGSFSLGSGGGDKSGRRIVKVRRDKLRKK